MYRGWWQTEASTWNRLSRRTSRWAQGPIARRTTRTCPAVLWLLAGFGDISSIVLTVSSSVLWSFFWAALWEEKRLLSQNELPTSTKDVNIFFCRRHRNFWLLMLSCFKASTLFPPLQTLVVHLQPLHSFKALKYCNQMPNTVHFSRR